MSEQGYTVVFGYLIDEGKDQYEILLFSGQRLFVDTKDVAHHFQMEAGEKAAYRFFLRKDASVRLEMPVTALEESCPLAPRTSFKYYDDGGTIPKSYDDPKGGPI